MRQRQVHIAVAAAAVVVIAIVALLLGRGMEGAALTGVVPALVLAGLISGESRAVYYGLPGVGVLVAVVDLVRKVKQNGIRESHPLP